MRAAVVSLALIAATPVFAASRYALVTGDPGTVQNVVAWDGNPPWTPPAGLLPIALPDASPVAPCWTYAGGNFAAAFCPVVPIDASAALATAAQVDAKIATATAGLVTAAQAAAAAPVQMVNNKVGSVAVPTLCRQQSAGLSIPSVNPAPVSWTFPNSVCAFAAPPSCWMDVTSGNASFTLDYPLNTARSTSAVTYSFTAHANVLTIALGTLSLTVAPPAGSTVVMTCTAAPA